MTQYSKKDVAALAMESRDKAFDPNVPTRRWLEKLVEEKGGIVKYVQRDQPTECVETDANGFVISLPLDVSEARNNFTIAHELGHIVLHHDKDNRVDCQYTRTGSNPCEWEANWYAADLLMPESEFRTTAKELKGDASAIARRFGVSGAAAKVRLSALGIKK